MKRTVVGLLVLLAVTVGGLSQETDQKPKRLKPDRFARSGLYLTGGAQKFSSELPAMNGRASTVKAEPVPQSQYLMSRQAAERAAAVYTTTPENWRKARAAEAAKAAATNENPATVLFPIVRTNSVVLARP